MDEQKGCDPFPWSYKPGLRKFLPEDPFFQDGDVHCSMLTKQIPVEDEDHYVIHSKHAEFECHVAGCHLPFSSLADYEAHYNSYHRNVCSYCKRSLPSTFLLDLHILEWHDTMFEMLAAKQAMFQCLVSSCPEKFLLIKERTAHLITIHHYPNNFRFDKPVKRTRTSNYESEEAMELNEDTQLNRQEGDVISAGSHKYRIPKHISFGRGGSRAFQRSKAKGLQPKLQDSQAIPHATQNFIGDDEAAMDET